MSEAVQVLVWLAIIFAVAVGGLYLVVPMIELLSRFVGRLLAFIPAVLGDAVRLIGQLATGAVFLVLMLLNTMGGRSLAGEHYSRALRGELAAAGATIYRLVLRYPLTLLGMSAALEGLEQRVPAAVMAAPGGRPAGEPGADPVSAVRAAGSPAPRATPAPPGGAGAGAGPVGWGGGIAAGAPTAEASDPGRLGEGYRHLGPVRRASISKFDGYEIVGTLPGGGSGSRLYVARPDAIKRAGFERDGQHGVGDVVIKVFSVHDGSSLPQIVRESRALEAARKLGLVLEHELTAERFLYVMRYVPGDSLGLVADRLHAAAGPDGLSDKSLREVIGYAADLVGTLAQYHASGLWHKDIKPDNIIVSTADGRAHLVDFGLLTPLRSAMTLTTHGTEYFRDPEMVRMALRGVKVADVDGVKFDIYGAGAVLYAVVENSFPAHGAMSQIGKRCPEALRWIVRRAMTDYDKRYASAEAMLADLRVVLTAADPFAVKPGMLPSVARGEAEPLPPSAPSAEAPRPASPEARAPGARPRRSAAEQLERARERVAKRRGRFAGGRFPWVSGAHGPRPASTAGAGQWLLVGAVVVGLIILMTRSNTRVTTTVRSSGGAAPAAVNGTAAGAGGAGAVNAAQKPAPRPQADPDAIGPASGRVEGLTVLMVSEWTASTTASQRAELTARVSRRADGLRARGFVVLDGDKAAELESSARARVGARPIGSDNAQAALVQWVLERSAGGGAPDAVVWFTDGREGLAGLETHLAPGEALKGEAGARARGLAAEALPGWRGK